MHYRHIFSQCAYDGLAFNSRHPPDKADCMLEVTLAVVTLLYCHHHRNKVATQLYYFVPLVFLQFFFKHSIATSNASPTTPT